MKSTNQNKGVYLFFYIIAGLVISALITACLQYAFPGSMQSLGRLFIIFILCIALIGYFLSRAGKTSLKGAGYILSVVVFSTLILFLYHLFAVDHLLIMSMVFFGMAIAGELIMFVIALIRPSSKIYAGIGAAVCVIAAGLILWGFTDVSFKTIACIVLSLVYVYFSSLYYLAYDDPDHSGLLEKSGMAFNIIALFIALYGRYTYSWRR